MNEKDSIPVNFEKEDGTWKINTWPDEEHKWIREKSLLQEYSRSKKEYVDGMYDMIVGNKNHKLKFH